jgi:glycosyltransferase involved in cell wall biosynthesis
MLAPVTRAKGSPLRVAVVAPPFYEVPPRTYGGTETVCHLLVEGLMSRGYDVTLVAAGASDTGARLIRTFEEPQGEGTANETTIEVVHAARAAAALEDLKPNLVHDHSRVGPLTAAARRNPTLVTVHAAVAGPQSQRDSFGALGRWVSLVALSDAQRASAPRLNWVGRVYNGIAVEDYPLRERKEDYVVVLGRLSPYKGVHLAIDAARAAGWRIVVAGTWTIPGENVYFEEHVRPRLGDGVEWIGEIRGTAKAELLAGAACLLFPVQWNEPFGLVMIEAMACGTPVVALRAGSVPEVVVDGVTGLICNRPADLPSAIASAVRLDARHCRDHVIRNFSAERMVQNYEMLYQMVLCDV